MNYRYLLFDTSYDVPFIIPAGPRLDPGLVPTSKLPELKSVHINTVRVPCAPFMLGISLSKSLLYAW
jgi:hypothetical protein